VGRGERRELSADGPKRTLAVPSPTMSLVHARLTKSGSRWSVEDAGSRNGVFVNGERVDRKLLGDGDLLEMGDAVFVFRERLLPPEAPEYVDAASLDAEPLGMRTLLPDLAARF